VAGYVLACYYLKDSDHIAARVARDHHERKTGTGYPRGVSKVDRIAEIVIVGDVYDALISPRPYRSVSYDNRSALEVVTEMAKKGEVSWDIVKVLIAQNRRDKPEIDEFTVSKERRGQNPAGNLHGITLGSFPAR
jgi:HD-GYP domain-containing protein (c-di-GMP phosphodiesterase class II)